MRIDLHTHSIASDGTETPADVARLVSLMRETGPLVHCLTNSVVRQITADVLLAAGAAFTFGYAEHAEMLTAAGARVVVFDPLVDRLPADAAGVVIGGGFPEEHAEALAANEHRR